jgi:hypothetical protein
VVGHTAGRGAPTGDSPPCQFFARRDVAGLSRVSRQHTYAVPIAASDPAALHEAGTSSRAAGTARSRSGRTRVEIACLQ